MFNLLAAAENEGLNGSLAQIVEKLKSLMDSFWIYIIIALAAVVVIWGAYIGIKIAIAHRNEENAYIFSRALSAIIFVAVTAHRRANGNFLGNIGCNECQSERTVREHNRISCRKFGGRHNLLVHLHFGGRFDLYFYDSRACQKYDSK